jgi:hypothetical protein
MPEESGLMTELGYTILRKGFMGIEDSVDFSFSKAEIMRKWNSLRKKYPKEQLVLRDNNAEGIRGRIIRSQNLRKVV